MMPLADVFVHIFVLVDAAREQGSMPLSRRPGPAPACADAGVLTMALARPLLARPSPAAFLAEVRPDRAPLRPPAAGPTRSPAGSAGSGRPARLSASPWSVTFPQSPGRTSPSRLSPSRAPAGCGAPLGGRDRGSGTPAGGGLPSPARGSPASVWPCGRTWGRGWCGPERSFRDRERSRGPFSTGQVTGGRAAGDWGPGFWAPPPGTAPPDVGECSGRAGHPGCSETGRGPGGDDCRHPVARRRHQTAISRGGLTGSLELARHGPEPSGPAHLCGRHGPGLDPSPPAPGLRNFRACGSETSLGESLSQGARVWCTILCWKGARHTFQRC